jgi:hypothetical protein
MCSRTLVIGKITSQSAAQRSEDIGARAPRETLPAPAASPTPGWGVRSPGSAAHDAAHAIAQRTQTESGGSPSNYEEVAGDHLLHVIGQESSPSLGRRPPRSGKIFGHGRLCYFDSQLEQFPVNAGCSTQRSLGSASESSCEFLRPRSVFQDAAVISASSTTRTLGGAKRSPYRGARCADYAAHKATIARARPTRAGRSAGRNRSGAFFSRTVSW